MTQIQSLIHDIEQFSEERDWDGLCCAVAGYG